MLARNMLRRFWLAALVGTMVAAASAGPAWAQKFGSFGSRSGGGGNGGGGNSGRSFGGGGLGGLGGGSSSNFGQRSFGGNLGGNSGGSFFQGQNFGQGSGSRPGNSGGLNLNSGRNFTIPSQGQSGGANPLGQFRSLGNQAQPGGGQGSLRDQLQGLRGTGGIGGNAGNLGNNLGNNRPNDVLKNNQNNNAGGVRLPDSLKNNLGDSLRNNGGRNLGDVLKNNTNSPLNNKLGDSLRNNNLGGSLKDNLGGSLKNGSLNNLGDSLRGNLGNSLRNNLGGTRADSVLRLPIGKNGTLSSAKITGVNFKPSHSNLLDQVKGGKLNPLLGSNIGRQLNINKQFTLHTKGDVSRQLNLWDGLVQRGGWQQRHCGPVNASYTKNCFSMWYSGPKYCPTHCWYPTWTEWVDWCWWDYCDPLWDPRPAVCRPVAYNPCGAWVRWDYPVWRPLPVLACGTWVDVPAVPVAALDLQLLAVRFVDPGHPEQQTGPRYRIWLRNNSNFRMNAPFNVMLLAATNDQATPELPQAGVRVTDIDAGQTLAVDIRLPFQANQMIRTNDGHLLPFTHLHVLVDSHNEVAEIDEANNGAFVLRGEILPVDPAIFAPDTAKAVPGSVVTIAGEGLGPEPGKVLVQVGDKTHDAEILGWYDLGVQVKMPELTLEEQKEASVVVVRGEGTAANPVSTTLAPAPAGVTPAP